MKLSEFIKYLQEQQKQIGDVELYTEVDDGRSTYSAKLNPRIIYRKIWPKHPDPAKWYLV